MLGRSNPRKPERHAEDSQPLLAQSEVIFSAGDDGDYDEDENSALHDQSHAPETQTVALPLRSTMQSRETGASKYK